MVTSTGRTAKSCNNFKYIQGGPKNWTYFNVGNLAAVSGRNACFRMLHWNSAQLA